MKIIISDTGAAELERLEFDITSTINKVLKHIPKTDYLGIARIKVTDMPRRKNLKNKQLRASYLPKIREQPASIELYLKGLFSHIKSPENFKLMIPIQEVGLAKTLCHEIGHHVKHLRSHGIKRESEEKFADSYAERIMDEYILENAESINNCFDELERMGPENIIDREVLHSMRIGWLQHYNAVEARNKR